MLRTPRIVLALAALLTLGTHTAPAEAGKEVFDESLYTFCDATILADHWGVDTTEAKARMGQELNKNGGKGRDALNEVLEGARAGKPETFCAFDDSSYSHQDAVDLAILWELDVKEAKRRVERLLLSGRKKRIDAALAKARAKSPEELAAVQKDIAQNVPATKLPPTSKAQRHEHLFTCLDRHYPSGLPIGKHKILLRLGVDEHGAVVTADMEENTFDNAEATACMIQFAKTWRFAVPEKGPRTLRIKSFALEFTSSAS